MFKSQAGLFAVHVPYRGAAPALQDLLAGQIDFAFDPGIGLNQVRAGKLKLLAIGSMHRSPLFPEVPTLHEAGIKDFDADTVFGFYAPAATPAAVVSRLNGEINKILATQAVRERIAALGGEALPLTPAQFAAKATEDSKRFGAIIKERKISGD
jgi:tripartite-type tricarboxylate transporter receptor subunit TctC